MFLRTLLLARLLTLNCAVGKLFASLQDQSADHSLSLRSPPQSCEPGRTWSRPVGSTSTVLASSPVEILGPSLSGTDLTGSGPVRSDFPHVYSPSKVILPKTNLHGLIGVPAKNLQTLKKTAKLYLRGKTGLLFRNWEFQKPQLTHFFASANLFLFPKTQ